jgi:hypothetical protein
LVSIRQRVCYDSSLNVFRHWPAEEVIDCLHRPYGVECHVFIPSEQEPKPRFYS